MIKRELATFLVVGLLTVLVDFLTYRALIYTALLAINAAKAAGFMTGTVFAYFANRSWTFGHHAHSRGSAWRFAILYMVTLATNVWVNAVALMLFREAALAAVQWAFLLATGISASLNFVGMKWFVFKAKPTSGLP